MSDFKDYISTLDIKGKVVVINDESFPQEFYQETNQFIKEMGGLGLIIGDTRNLEVYSQDELRRLMAHLKTLTWVDY